MDQCVGGMVMSAAFRALLEMVGGEQQRLVAVAAQYHVSLGQG